MIKGSVAEKSSAGSACIAQSNVAVNSTAPRLFMIGLLR